MKKKQRVSTTEKVSFLLTKKQKHFWLVMKLRRHCNSPHVVQSQIGDQNYAETWSVQLFRSIDSSSAAGLPRTQAALKMGLSAQKGKVVDFSIQVTPPTSVASAA